MNPPTEPTNRDSGSAGHEPSADNMIDSDPKSESRDEFLAPVTPAALGTPAAPGPADAAAPGARAASVPADPADAPPVAPVAPGPAEARPAIPIAPGPSGAAPLTPSPAKKAGPHRGASDWLLALTNAVLLVAILDSILLRFPLISTPLSGVAKTAVFGSTIWALTTAYEDEISTELTTYLSSVYLLLPLLIGGVWSVCYPVAWIRCDEDAVFDHKPCAKGETLIQASAGLGPILNLDDGYGLKISRALFPLDTNAISYPTDFKPSFHVVVSLDHPSLQQVPSDEHGVDFTPSPCTSHFCVRVGDKELNLPPGGLVLGSSGADETVLALVDRLPIGEALQSQPTYYSDLKVSPGELMKLELMRKDDGQKYESCGFFTFRPQRKRQLWSISSQNCHL